MPAIPDLNRGRRLSTNAAITNLVMTIESGAMRPDDPLFAQRMTHNKAHKAALETDVLSLERQLAPSMVRITEEMIHAFGGKMAHALRDGSNQFRSEYVRLFVDRAELSTAGIGIFGTINALERALIHDGKADDGPAPIFDQKWCQKRTVALGIKR